MLMKFSRQRAAILSFLQSRKDHPSAELVYAYVKRIIRASALEQFIAI